MPVSITRTTRDVKNKKTGIDMSVTGYDSASSARQVKDYHVVVITNLAYFKLPEHSEEDVVQFMVPRDYAAFEKLQKELMASYPELNFPSLPRKFHVFMGPEDIEERQVSFDCILQIVAKTTAIASSIPVLQFLGFDPLADRKYYKARRKYLQEREEKATKEQEKEKALLGEHVEQINKGLFGENEKKQTPEPEKDMFQPFEADSIFEDGGSKSKKSAKVSLLEEDEDSDLFIPSGVRTEKKDVEEELVKPEDNSELLNVSETLDDVLKIAEKKTSTKPTKKVAPSSNGSKASGLFDLSDNDTTAGVDAMGTDDIMKYIQQNQTADDDDLDIF